MTDTSRYTLATLDPELSKHRKIFVELSTLNRYGIAEEELKDLPSPKPYSVYDFLHDDYRRIFAYVCVYKHSIQKPKWQRKMSWGKGGEYQCLIWYLFKSDVALLKADDNARLVKNPVPISRILSFFPTSLAILPTQRQIMTMSDHDTT